MSPREPGFIKVSIIIPVYNVESYIVECLDSLINQTLKEIEIILIDDHSTDSSGKICDEYTAKDNRVVVIHNETNIRQGLSRNKGIEVASGEYIGFVDPDDWVDFDFFEKLYTSAKQNNSDIAKTERIDISTNGNRVIKSGLNKKITEGLKKGTPIFLLFTYEHWSAIFKREIIIKNGVQYPDLRNAQDIIFLLGATYFSKTICTVSGSYYYYRIHPNSISASKKKAFFKSKILFLSIYINFINNHKMEKEHYDLAFIRAISIVKNDYKKIDKGQGEDDFRIKYVKAILELLTQYKYDNGYLLDNFYYGFTNEGTVQQLEKSYTYRIGKGILWLPSKIKKFLKSP